MKTNLLLLKSSLLKTSGVLKTAFLLLVLLLMGTATRAQVVYSMGEPGNTTAATSGDLIKKMNYDGTNVSTVITGTSAGLIQPLNVALDGNNNRIFVSEGNLSGNVIKVITGSSVTGTITSANSAYIKDINYDVVGNWLYYITEGGDITQVTANDALYRVHPDGTGSQTVAASVTKNPYRLEVDAANNKVYVVDVSFSGRSIKTVDLANSNAVTSRAFATTLTSVYDVALDKVTGYLYYCAEGGSAATLSATDQVRRQNIDGTNDVQIAASVCNSPFRLGLDAGNNRLYVGDAYYGSGKIVAINLTNNTFSTTLNFATGQNFPQLYDFGVPDRPNVTTTSASSIAATSATLGGTLVYGYGLSTERGVVYSSSNSTPTVSDTKAVTATVTANGAYSGSVTGLSPSTTYYARAYAVNGAGTTYGSVVSFLTQSNDATLSALNISAGTLNPAFSSATIAYTATVANANSSVTITPTKNNGGASIQVNNLAATSGSGSTVNLNIGDNAIPVKVTAADGTTTKTYTITFTRPKAAQTITFASTATKTFGDGDFAAGGSASSGLTVSYSSDNPGVATIVSGQIHIIGAGTVNITASQAGDGNTSAASNVVQVLTVNKASQSITFNTLPAKTYGNADFAPGATATSGLNVTYSSDNTSVATIVSNQVHIIGQGTATITAVQAGNSNYNAASNATQTLSVGKATVTVTAVAKTKIYGNADPAFTYTATGVVGTDAPTGALSRVTPTTNIFVGTYAIDLGTLSYGGNYNLTYTGANLTITKRPITILPIAKTKIYGDADPFLNQYQFISGSLAPDDGSTDQYGRAAGESVGSYLMTLGNKKFVSTVTFADVTANYDITVQPAYFTITAKPIIVSANAQTKTYGAADPALTYVNDALAFSDSFTGALTRATGEAVGSYAITKGTLALNSNYTLTFNGSNLTIGKKSVNITANAKTKTYGAADPALDYTADALAFSDAFTGSLTRVAGENVGMYAISQGSLALNSNYNLNYTGANLNIGTKTINVIANAATKTYGEADPALAYNADALVSGDAFTGALTRTAGELAGSYPITQGSLALSSNYVLNYTGANLTIGKRDITVNAFAQNVPYGDADPATIGYNITGNTLLAGDAITGALGREPGTAVGTYAITQNTLAVSNANSYNITFNSAPFNIIPRPITVTSPFKVKVYGDADPALTYSVTAGSLLPGDELTGSLVRDAGENSGPYSVHQGTVAINNPNYNVTYNLFNFEIDRAPLTMKADDKTKLVNAPNPTFTYTITGFKNGDNESAFSSPIMFQNLPLSSAPVGTYSIDFANASAVNYDLTQQSGVLTVRAASANADLTALTLSNDEVGNVAYTPTFDPATDTYNASVGDDVGYLYLTGVLSDPNASLFRINGFEATSGNPSVVNVSPGDNQYQIQINAEDGTTTKIYTLNVTRPLETNADLYAVSYYYGSENGYIPDLDPNTLDYTVTVPTETTNVRIYASPSSYYAAIKIDGQQPEGLYTKNLAFGDNPVSIKVSAQNRDVTKTYTVNFKRPLPSNNKLFDLTISAGTLSPAFNTNTLNYTASVASTVNILDVQPYVADTSAVYKINGQLPVDKYQPTAVNLSSGQNTITVQITAKSGDVREYVVVVTKEVSTDASLANLTVNTGALSPGFSSDIYAYSQTVGVAVSSVNITPTANAAGTTVTVNTAPVVSGNHINYPLNYGVNTFTVFATAESGATQQYVITITRATPSSSTVAKLTLDPAVKLNATTGTGDVNYTTSVSPDLTSVTLTTVAQNNGTVKVNGVAVNNGATSAPIALTSNPTLITTVITAEDGVTSRTYTISVNRTGSNNAIIDLKVTPASQLVTTTGTSTVNYKTSVDPATTSITVTPVAKDATATIKINGVTVASGVASAPIALNMGPTVINTVVTAQDGTTVKTYSLTVNRTGSNNAIATFKLNPLSTLTTIDGPSTVNYVTSVATNVANLTVTPTAQNAGATIKINGVVVASGAASDPITINDGANVINAVVTAQDGTTIKTYSITVNKTGSTNAFASLKLDPSSTLVTATGTGTVNYTTTVAPTTASVKLITTTQETNATIKLNGVTQVSGVASDPILLPVGTTTITAVVTAQDGLTTRSYVVVITRPLSNNAIASLKLNPNSSLTTIAGSSTVNYAAYVAPATTSVTVTPTADDANATIKVNGVTVVSGSASAPIVLNSGATVINTVVTAQDGTTTRSYSIMVNRTGSNNAIVKLKLTPASTLIAITGTSTVNYNAFVGPEVTSVNVTPVAQDLTATIVVDGTTVASGVASAAIPLNAGPTTINTVVTAQDGVTVKTYSITVYRTGSNNAILSSIKLSPNKALTTTTGSSTVNYAASVDFGTASISVVPVSQEAHATISVAGEVVASGATSSPIALGLGANTIVTTVTAQDGTTIKTYAITVTRASEALMVDKNDSKLLFANKAANSFTPGDNDGVVVHQGVSPNGDGSNDFLVIEGISAYAGNKISIMNTSGTLVFETKDYGKDGSNLFDGHSNKNGALLKPGTYYYALEYKVEKQSKRKTGFIIIKY